MQTWNLFSTGSLEGGATPPARFISNSLPPLSFSVVGTSTVRLPHLNTRAAAPLTANDTGSPPAGHSVRRSTGRATQLKWPQMLWRGSLAPSTCSTSFQDHAPGEWRYSYGIPSRRRSNNGLIKLGQCSGTRSECLFRL